MSREPIKRTRLITDLRRQIVGGTLKPGARLPTRDELQRAYASSSITVQQALNILADDGFIISKARQGTFVVDHPPHRFHYGLVIPDWPTDGRYEAQFWNALVGESKRMQQRSPRRFSIFHSINENNESAHHKELYQAIAAERMAGLIVPAMHRLKNLELESLPLPVVVTTTMKSRFPNFHLDITAFFRRALDYFSARNIKRVGVLMLHNQELHVPMLRKLLNERGMICHERWLLAGDMHERAWSARAAQAIVHLDQKEPPEGLLIVDDNLVEQATVGLHLSGIGSERSLSVIAHCNFPWPTPNRVPVIRLGFDIRAYLNRCVEAIDQCHAGIQPNGRELVQPVFEHEISLHI